MKSIFSLFAALLAVSSASAVLVDNPLSLQTQFLAGILNGQPGDSNPTTEEGYAQAILNLTLGQKTGPAGQEGVFEANTLFDYAGTITFNGGQSTFDIEPGGNDSISIPAGWGGALVKYDGQQAGYVLYVFGGTASTIPEYPWNLWTTNESQYQASHVTLFRGTGNVTPTPFGVPDGGSMLMLLGAALASIEGLRRKFLGASAA